MKGSVFSKIDFRDAYLQIELDDESQELAVINTHLGLFKYVRMAFGLKPAPAVFQKIVDKLISCIPGVSAYLDDLIIAASSYDEHEAILRQLFDRIREYGFRVSPEKCMFAVSEISFLGFIVDEKGRRPDPNKASKIRSMKAPGDQKQLSSFLGAVCFYSRFVPKMSELRGPLDRLMKKDVEWSWTKTEQIAFEKLKNTVADATMLSHFHEDWPIIVAADASNYGIGGVLCHVNPDGVEVPIAHYARSLTATEQKYSQIEKEGLALIFTIKKAHKFIFGRKFKLQTDHQPLLAIFGSKKDLPVHSQNRLVRWATTLMSYDFDLSYVSTSKFAKADWLSRMIQEFPRNQDDVVIAEIWDDDNDDSLSSNFTPVMQEDIQVASEKDYEVSAVMKLLSDNSWKSKPDTDIEKYWSRLKDRLKIIQGCLLVDDRVIVPKQLQSMVLKQLHDGHPGVVHMKQKARSFVFWRGLDSEIEKLVRQCNNCQENAKMPRVVPLKLWPEPEKPWTRIHVDFCGPLNGQWLLVVVDAKSKYAEVKLTRSISAMSTVDLMEEIFSIHGYPEVLVSDNGTQFTSHFFKKMCESHGIIHKTSATYYPRSNGAAERFVDTLKRGIAKIKGEGSVNQQILNKFLISYRNTPHSALSGATPAECHFGRSIRTTMSLLMPKPDANHQADLSEYQKKMKQQYDSRNGTRAKHFQVGQQVYVKVQHGNKSEWDYGVVSRKIGSVLHEVQVGSRLQRSHVNQLRLRYGDKSSVEKFEDTIYPMFFTFANHSDKFNNSPGFNHVSSPRVHGGETNIFYSAGLSADSLLPASQRVGLSGEDGGDADNNSLVLPNWDSDANMARGRPKELKKSNSKVPSHQSTSKPTMRSMKSTVLTNVSSDLPATDLSHSLRRSQRLRNASARYTGQRNIHNWSMLHSQQQHPQPCWSYD